jgi:hypothetical protein
MPVFTDGQGRLTRETLGKVLAISETTCKTKHLEGELANHVSFGIVSLFFPGLGQPSLATYREGSRMFIPFQLDKDRHIDTYTRSQSGQYISVSSYWPFIRSIFWADFEAPNDTNWFLGFRRSLWYCFIRLAYAVQLNDIVPAMLCWTIVHNGITFTRQMVTVTYFTLKGLVKALRPCSKLECMTDRQCTNNLAHWRRTFLGLSFVPLKSLPPENNNQIYHTVKILKTHRSQCRYCALSS